jgi:hypothetical protein
MPQDQKALPTLQPTQAAKRSVQEFPEPTGGQVLTLLLQAAIMADEAPSWWSASRDVYLDKFWPTEPFLAGAIFSVCSRNASFRYELTGPRSKVVWAQQLLAQAEFGQGWQSFMMKVSQDYLTMGNAAFVEVIRPARARTSKAGTWYDAIRMPDPDTDEYVWFPYDRHSGKPIYSMVHGRDFKVVDYPFDLPVGIAHLDSLRTTRTGNPDYPAIYQDIKGNPHKLAAHQVLSLEEMPSPRDHMYGVQHCSVDRCLKLAQTLRDMLIYKHEKVSGRFARAIHLTNIDAEAIQDAVDQANTNADAKGLIRYLQPIIAATLDPNAKPSVETLELASMPEGFDEETAMNWYIAGVAMCLGVDYGFLAPLPGGRLGTGTQAETAERQAKGKSSRLFLNNLSYKFNFSGLLPQGVTLRFAVPDPYEESEKDRAFARRARSLSILVNAGIIDPLISRQLMVDWRDLDPDYLALLGEGDLTPNITLSGTEPPRARVRIKPREPVVTVEGGAAAPGGNGNGEEQA